MPIKPENRHHYTGKAWKEARQRALERAGNRCLWCRKPNGTVIRQMVYPWYAWLDTSGEAPVCRDEKGVASLDPVVAELLMRAYGYEVRIVLTTAHYPDPNPENIGDDNLCSLCQRCHLRTDHQQHVENARKTRQAKRATVQPASRPARHAQHGLARRSERWQR
jgi:hypothetical protein